MRVLSFFDERRRPSCLPTVAAKPFAAFAQSPQTPPLPRKRRASSATGSACAAFPSSPSAKLYLFESTCLCGCFLYYIYHFHDRRMGKVMLVHQIFSGSPPSLRPSVFTNFGTLPKFVPPPLFYLNSTLLLPIIKYSWVTNFLNYIHVRHTPSPTHKYKRLSPAVYV